MRIGGQRLLAASEAVAGGSEGDILFAIAAHHPKA